MGVGDDIMATSYARMAYERHPIPVVLSDARHRPSRSPVFNNNPILATPDHTPFQWVIHGKRARPYFDYERSTRERHVWINDGPRRPGEIYFTAAERPRLMEGAGILIEPNVKPGQSPNKSWGFERYQAVVDGLPSLTFWQCDYGAPLLNNVRRVRSADIRQGFRILRDSVLYIGPEGGMHHAAAALSIPAVVLFGGFISPDIMGYEGHANLAGSDEACGMMVSCEHCKAAMEAITPEDVATATLQQL